MNHMMNKEETKHLKKSLGPALITFSNSELTVSTGTVERHWQWTGHGFRTIGIKHSNHKKEWNRNESDSYLSDWALPTTNSPPAAILTNAEINISNDEGFTTEHLSFSAEMEYPDQKLGLRFVVWAYPDGPGMRVALFIRAMDGFNWDHQVDRKINNEETNVSSGIQRGYQRLENLPIDFSESLRHKIGHYSDTQNRNDPHLSLLLEKTDPIPATHPSVCEWANAICVEKDEDGLVLLKESHGCVNTPGHDKGAFLILPDHGLENHGWGIRANEIDSTWRPAWATWTLLYQGGRRERMSAIKSFDRLRYPVTPDDLYVQANTWGSSRGYLEHRDAASEENVLREIESCADLGIEVLQIDDGWQGNNYDSWTPTKERYPDENWDRVKNSANKAGVKLGLWLAAEPPSLEDLVRNVKEGGFVTLKLDFAILNSRKKIDTLMKKARELVLLHNHNVRINWDLTEVCPRYGFYFAREFGCIYLENRKPVIPRTVTYRPGTVLKDLWEVSHYCNLLKFQGSVQNLKMVDPKYSDAEAYSQAYCVAIPLMSNPLFFCETHFFSEDVRREIRPILKAYRKVSQEISDGIIHPVGSIPDGTQYTGFECERSSGQRQFLLIFREPWNDQPSSSIALPHLSGSKVILENLIDGSKWNEVIDSSGLLTLNIEQAGDFRFLALEVN